MVLVLNINPTHARTLLDDYYCNELNLYNVYILKIIFETCVVFFLYKFILVFFLFQLFIYLFSLYPVVCILSLKFMYIVMYMIYLIFIFFNVLYITRVHIIFLNHLDKSYDITS